MRPSIYQEAIYDFIKNGTGNAVIEAVAGSGKTTTIVESLKLIPSNKAVLFVAFNKHIAEELQNRVPPHVEARTLHSVGWSLSREQVRTRLQANKDTQIMRKLFNTDDKKERQTFYSMRRRVCQIVSLLKANNVSPDVSIKDLKNIILDIMDNHSIEEMNKPPYISQTAATVFLESVRNTKIFSFDDMIYWPLNNGLTMNYDYVMVDEAQDLSPVQMDFILSLVNPDNGRVIAVGDSHQAIYGFRGASTNAMDQLKAALNAVEMPLSICYRCARSIVEQAQTIVPQIQPSETAINGCVETYRGDYIDRLKEGNYVLCRVTSDLVEGCLKTLQYGKKASVRGRDIGEGLEDLINNLDGSNDDTPIEELKQAINEYQDTRQQKLAGRTQELIALDDTCDTLRVLCHGCETAGDVVKRINSIFDNKIDGIIFSTIHKSKGLETDTVFLIRPDLLPHPRSETGWQLEQESNLKYIALTRAKTCFIEVQK